MIPKSRYSACVEIAWKITRMSFLSLTFMTYLANWQRDILQSDGSLMLLIMQGIHSRKMNTVPNSPIEYFGRKGSWWIPNAVLPLPRIATNHAETNMSLSNILECNELAHMKKTWGKNTYSSVRQTLFSPGHPSTVTLSVTAGDFHVQYFFLAHKPIWDRETSSCWKTICFFQDTRLKSRTWPE